VREIRTLEALVPVLDLTDQRDGKRGGVRRRSRAYPRLYRRLVFLTGWTAYAAWAAKQPSHLPIDCR